MSDSASSDRLLTLSTQILTIFQLPDEQRNEILTEEFSNKISALFKDTKVAQLKETFNSFLPDHMKLQTVGGLKDEDIRKMPEHQQNLYNIVSETHATVKYLKSI